MNRESTSSLETLPNAECLRLLTTGTVGRLAVVIAGEPHILPLNYAADQHGVVVFRTAELSTAAQVSLAKVAFEVDEFDAARREGWSVVVHGYGWDITDAVDRDSRRLRRLKVEPWASGNRDHWFKIVPSTITGRRLVAAK